MSETREMSQWVSLAAERRGTTARRPKAYDGEETNTAQKRSMRKQGLSGEPPRTAVRGHAEETGESIGEDRQWVRLKLELRRTATRGLGPHNREEVLRENLEMSPLEGRGPNNDEREELRRTGTRGPRPDDREDSYAL